MRRTTLLLGVLLACLAAAPDALAEPPDGPPGPRARPPAGDRAPPAARRIQRLKTEIERLEQQLEEARQRSDAPADRLETHERRLAAARQRLAAVLALAPRAPAGEAAGPRRGRRPAAPRRSAAGEHPDPGAVARLVRDLQEQSRRLTERVGQLEQRIHRLAAALGGQGAGRGRGHRAAGAAGRPVRPGGEGIEARLTRIERALARLGASRGPGREGRRAGRGPARWGPGGGRGPLGARRGPGGGRGAQHGPGARLGPAGSRMLRQRLGGRGPMWLRRLRQAQGHASDTCPFCRR